MSIKKVTLYVTKLKEDLNNGLSWLKKDDEGNGSIQEKYTANDFQIATFRKHPAFLDFIPNGIIFTISDDELDNNECCPSSNDDELEKFANL